MRVELRVGRLRKRWARVAVTIWVLTTVAVLAGVLGLFVVNLPGYLQQAWQSLFVQLDTAEQGGATNIIGP